MQGASEDSVDLVRRVWDAADRRDTELILTFYDPEAEFDVSAFGLGHQRIYHGHEGLRQLFAEWREIWSEADSELLEVIGAGERVVAVYRYRGRGRGSGLQVDHEFATLWTVRAGKITRVTWFTSREDALEAAGLDERPD